MIRTRLLIASAALALVGIVVALVPSWGGQDVDDNRFLLVVDGRASIAPVDGAPRRVDSGNHELADGDAVRMLEGTAVLELPGERELWLRNESEVVAGVEPEVLDGDAVVVVDDGGIRFTAGDVDVALTKGAARVQRGLGVTVAMYRGVANLRSAGRTLDGGLHALRQVTVPATGLLPHEAVPLVYDDARTDPWDRQFLGDAIDFGRVLDGLSRGFTSQLGRAAVDADLLRQVLPALADHAEFSDDLVEADRSAGESLVGAVITVEAADGAFDRAEWDEVFAFRDDGARWGLVALDQQVRRDAVRSRIDGAIGRSPLLFAAGPVPARTASTPATTTTTSTTAPPNGGGGEEPDPPDEPPTTVPPLPPLPPLPEEPPEEPPDGSDDLVDVVDEILEGDLVQDLVTELLS